VGHVVEQHRHNVAAHPRSEEALHAEARALLGHVGQLEGAESEEDHRETSSGPTTGW
jgi:hypothetical protein